MNVPKETPSQSEIEQQLKRLLASDVFASAPKLSPLLLRIVRDSLSGAATPEYEYVLGIELFDRSRDWSPLTDNIVRQNVANLRVSLDNYYSERGTRDLVQIEIPRRQGFRARFSYNPHAPAEKRCAVVSDRFYGTLPCLDPSDARQFIRELRKCIEGDPLYANAYAHLAEIMLVSAMCGPPSAMTHADCVAEAEAAVTTCLSLSDDIWLAQIVSGALACCRFRWDSAAEAFDKALKIASRETRGHFWYIAFLVASGRMDEASKCIKERQSNSNPLLDPRAYMIEAACFYAESEFEVAQTVLALGLARGVKRLHSWVDLTEGVKGPERVDLVNWLTEALMSCILMAWEKNDLASVYADAALEHGGNATYAGIACIALARKGKRHWREVRRRVAAVKKSPKWYGPVSIALACMSVGEEKEAIAFLKQACDEGNPMMAWLHVLPLFSSLRHRRGFLTLLKRVAPPH